MKPENDTSRVRSLNLLDRHRSQLLVVDVQLKLLPVIEDGQQLLDSITFLLDAARVMNVPVVVSEQYPKGLGHSVPQIADHSVSKRIVEKLRFSAAEAFEKIPTDASMSERSQVVIVGIEAHICVLQTALDLIAEGKQVFVVDDAIGSRTVSQRESAVNRIRDAGGIICCAESVAFEWCEAAGTNEFRQISRLVRERDAARTAD